MQTFRYFGIVVNSGHKPALNGRYFAFLVNPFRLFNIPQTGSVLRDNSGQASRKAVRVENVLRTDVFDVGKFIFCGDILGLNGVEAWLRRKGIDFLGKGGSK